MGFILAIYTIFAVHLIWLMVVGLKIGCLARVSKLATSGPLVLLLTVFFSIDFLVSLVKVVIAYNAAYFATIEPYFPFVDVPLTILKVIGAAVCIARASRQSALILVAAGLFLDAAVTMTMLWLGLYYGQNPTFQALASAILFYGLGRLNRETRLAELNSFGRIPLWQEVQGAPAPVSGEVG